MAELFDTHSSDDDNEPEFKFIDINGFHLRQMGKHHSLWGELVWITGQLTSKHILAKDPGFEVEGKTVVEFGSGVGLCVCSAAISGAKNVVGTDYDEPQIIENLIFNTQQYNNVKIVGHTWGKDVQPVLDANNGEQFDVALLSDLIFNHSCHKNLLRSLSKLLKPNGRAIVSYSHHVPRRVNLDLNFFTLAQKKFGFKLHEILKEKHAPMFPQDEGDLELRTTCHLVELTFSDNQVAN